jgi:Pyridoxamine 5'-phosphate oxidase like
VNVATASSSSWVSLTGHAGVVDDLARKRELWNKVVEAWFPNGPEDPDVVLLRVEAASGEYWDSPGGRLATAVSFAKAKLTGQRYDGARTSACPSEQDRWTQAPHSAHLPRRQPGG